MKKDLGANVQDVFAGPQTIIFLEKGDKLDEKLATAALAKHKFKAKSIKRDDTLIL